MPAHRILGALLLGALLVPRAHAAGINLRWDHCYGDGGAANKNFACNTNFGSNVLAESFVLATALNSVVTVRSHIEITTASASLPAWWQLYHAGTCRQQSLSAGASTVPVQSVACADWAGGQASNIFEYDAGTFGPSTASLLAVSACPCDPAELPNLSPGQEYGAFTVFINHQKSVGTGSCAGCSTPACIYVRSAEIWARANGSLTPDVTLTVSANGTDSNTATWQGGAGVPALPGGACAGPVPARASTWGLVKSLYR